MLVTLHVAVCVRDCARVHTSKIVRLFHRTNGGECVYCSSQFLSIAFLYVALWCNVRMPAKYHFGPGFRASALSVRAV